MRVHHTPSQLCLSFSPSHTLQSFRKRIPTRMLIAHPLISFRPLISFTHSRFSSHPIRNLYKHRRTAMSETNNVGAGDEDAKFGFTRSEMYKENLSNTVDPYNRHVFLCFKSPSEWISHLEKQEGDALPKVLSSALKARKDDITVKTKMTIFEASDGFEDGDVLIFPEMIKYKGLNESEVNSFVDDVIVNGKPWGGGVQESMSGSHIFVCAHGSRDKRCGVCGPVLIEMLKEGIESRGLQDQVFVSACSHIGGHKYAGNLIIYSPDAQGKIMGHWYGYVTPDDVPEVLDQHIGKAEVIERIWRGQMGGEGKKKAETEIPNGKEEKKSKKHKESETVATKDVGGCCQGANGVSCCRDASVEGSGEKKVKGASKLSCWMGSLERSEVLAGIAVVGAVATIAVAYSLYKRSS